MVAEQPPPIISVRDETNFKDEKSRLIVRMLVVSTLVIYLIETLIMYVLEYYLEISHPVVYILDGIILIACLVPFNFYFVVRPMYRRIEAHEQSNQELRKSYEVLERFFAIRGVSIAYMDASFNFIRVNQDYAGEDENAPDFFIGKNHFDLYPNTENQIIFSQVVKTGEPYHILEKPFEYAGHPERGTTYWDWSLLPIKEPDGKVSALLLVLANVTARVRAQQAQAHSERRFRAAFNQTFQHIGLLDPQGCVIVFNQTALDYSGLRAEDMEGKPLWTLAWWGGLADVLDQLRDAVKQAVGGQVVQCEQRVRSATGELAIMDITIKPLLDEKGETVLLIYEARDITPRIRAEEALKRSENEIKRLYQAEMTAHKMAETLREAVSALTGSLQVDTVLETLLDHLYRVVPYTSAHIAMFDTQYQLVVRAARGEDEWKPEERLLNRRFDAGEIELARAILVERRMTHIPDTMLYPGTSFLPVDKFVRSWVGIPLRVGDEVLGICVLEHVCPDFFSDNLIHWANAVTGQAGVAIQNAWLFEQVQDGREHLQALSRRLVEAQESERHYIARELHDEAGQALASLMVGLRLLERDGGDRAAVTARCAELKEIADGVLENLHRLAINLRPATLDHLGLVAALRQHAETIGDQHGLVVQFETVGRIDRLPGDVETAIYRIVQEALTNVIRHAKATHVDILLERRNDGLFVIIEDNGIGFDPQVTHAGHLGMLGMQERAFMLGGEIKVESAPGKGVMILLEVPCLFEY